MTRPVRPMLAFILRLWREPGAPQGSAGWRGLIRRLETKDKTSGEVPFQGLDNLPKELRPLLADEESPAEPNDLPVP